MRAWRWRGRPDGSGSMKRAHKGLLGIGAVVIAAIAVLVLSSVSFATKQPLSIAVTPTSTTAGSSGNAFTFKATTTAATSGQLSVVVPAGWTAPQATNSTLPGYVVIQKLTCASAGPFPTSITGSGPWTITFSYNCAQNKNFSLTYGGTVATSKVSAPTAAGFYEFTSQADFGSGFQRLASQPVVQVTAPSVHLAVTGLPSTVAAGASNSFTVSARDSKNNLITKYAGTVHLTSNDPAATLPADYTFTSSDAGTHTFTPGAAFVTTGSRTLTATDTSNAAISGSQTVTVGPGAATHFVVSGLANPSTAGVAQTVTVTAKDAFNNIATGYMGTVHFTSSDGGATLPPNYSFIGADAGSHTFGVTLRAVGGQDVTATDTLNSSISGLQTVAVNPGTATHFLVNAPASATAGVAQSVTVTAKDSSNNTATSYGGTVHFTSSDGAAVLPANYSLNGGDAGSHTFAVTLKTAGSQSVTATDTANASITGTDTVTVASAGATHFAVSAPASATAGSAFSTDVTALDQFNNTAAGYAGTVHFTSSDGQAVLPANSTLSSGAGTFSVTLKTAGSQSVTATDTANASITGSQTVTVAAGSATQLVVTGLADPSTAGAAQDVTVSAEDAFGNLDSNYGGLVHFTSTDGAATLPADYAFDATDHGSHTYSGGVTLKTAGSQTATASDGSLSGSQTVTVSDTLYVATTGSDSNPGSQAAPLKSIQAAVNKTSSFFGVLNITVAAGSYTEGGSGLSLASGSGIPNGIQISGAGAGSTIIRDAPSVVIVNGVTGVGFSDLSLDGLAPGGSGSSAYGLREINGATVTLTHVDITGANGSAGATLGGNGASGPAGNDGGNATNGVSSCSGPTNPGAGGTGVEAGGVGGHGGCGQADGGDGTDGNRIIGGTGGTGGSGGAQGASVFTGSSSGSLGSDGTDGGNGTPGSGGAGGSGGTAGLTWLSNGGQAGTTGTPGVGGGGGGGGGGGCFFAFSACSISYSGGGGGGGGGAGGPGGHGAGSTGGGGSFGIYLVNSTVTVVDSSVTAGNGGAGGNGSKGAAGGAGGAGGSGGFPSSLGAPGGNGGTGGSGGSGGGGGGGAGGPSVAIYRSGSSTYGDGGGNTLAHGLGGTGGVGGTGGSVGNGGVSGTTGAVANVTP